MYSNEEKCHMLDVACDAHFAKLMELNKYSDQYSARDYEQVLDNIKDIYTIKAMRGSYGPDAQRDAHHHVQALTPMQHQGVRAAVV